MYRIISIAGRVKVKWRLLNILSPVLQIMEKAIVTITHLRFCLHLRLYLRFTPKEVLIIHYCDQRLAMSLAWACLDQWSGNRMCHNKLHLIVTKHALFGRIAEAVSAISGMQNYTYLVCIERDRFAVYISTYFYRKIVN